ncbi:MAG: ATP synthase F1 subunit delta [Phycisphaerae bacterium]|nr:ATP synthase F1 subunit delta [Phycisphaerae bacterium]
MPLFEGPADAVANVYAQSLFELARSKGGEAAISQSLAELEAIVELARTDPKFGEFLSSRIISAKDRAASIDRIFKGRVCDLTLNFLKVLNHKDRLGHLAKIEGSFDRLAQESFGRVEVDVYAAEPLDRAQVESISQRLRAVLGKEPVVHPYVDPRMIGGIKIQIGDRFIDASIASRLRKMRDRLANEGAATLRDRAGRILDSRGDAASSNGH